MAGKRKRPSVLIEHWLPITEIGVEAQRERGASSALPPLYFLHVWWARRPLTVSRAALLASLLPACTDHDAFKRTLGIFSDVAAQKDAMQRAKRAGKRVDGFTHKRAFTYTPDEAGLAELDSCIRANWGMTGADEPVRVLDPMAGGGSIPFEAMRYGFDTHANELNPVGAVVLKATLEYPAPFGPSLASDIRQWAAELHRRAKPDLEAFFPSGSAEEVMCYVWARTVRCPECELVVPLSPNWWLTKSGESAGTAVEVIAPELGDTCSFRTVEVANTRRYNPNHGTVANGTARCPRAACGAALPRDYIKGEAQTGRMGHQLYAVAIKTASGRGFRPPDRADEEAAVAAAAELREHWASWQAQDLIPDETRYVGPADRSANYGVTVWHQAFAPRQLLAHITYLRHYLHLQQEIRAEQEPARAEAIAVYLQFILDKGTDRNSLMSRWIPQRQVLANTFDRHDFSFKWSYGEMNLLCPGLGYEWATDQVCDAYVGIANLAAAGASLFDPGRTSQGHVSRGNAAAYRAVPDGSVHLICVDPPYYDNVMYAECADFFYVWQKRGLGRILPDLYADELTDKDSEATANVARFKNVYEGRRKRKDEPSATQLADQDYEAKMRACFARMHQLLREDGVLTVMFTHKRVDAWDTLAAALIAAGFEITSSWPIQTEFEHSLHQAKKNACESTILLVCRKREHDGEGAWLDDLLPEIRRTARAKVEEFESLGIRGVDLLVSTYGPILQVISSNWPVRGRTGEDIRPDVALDEGRKVLTDYRFQQIVSRWGTSLKVDPVTEWTILAWDLFRAARFPWGEAWKLAIAVGIDNIDDEIVKRRQIAEKKSKDLVLLEPKARLGKGRVDPQAEDFSCMLDALHTAMVVFDEDGVAACRRFLEKTGLGRRDEFAATVDALLHAMPQAQATQKQFATLREIALNFLSGRFEVPDIQEELDLGLGDEDDEQDDDEE